MGLVEQWAPVDPATKASLVERLSHKPVLDAGGSLHVTEVHIRDDDGTIYRYFRAWNDGSEISVADDIERLSFDDV